jgi:isopenicillin-N N-acyltransferase like protein
MKNNSKPWRKFFIWGLILAALTCGTVVWYKVRTHVRVPKANTEVYSKLVVTHPEKDFYGCDGCWLQKSNSGLWEMYIEGDPFRRGIIEGKISKDLVGKQEKAFIDRLYEMVPSTFYRHFLKYFIYWFNRDLDTYVAEEYKLQIYGISLSASENYSFMGHAYQRMLNYHSAHDIGHALVNMGMIGCTSFAAWDSYSKDGKLIVGRNFDFYMGDEFAAEKIVCFEKPDGGYPFMYITWGGMIGAVSGMNEQGLTVTINAARSKIPYAARTPISLLAREILQYAGNIREAMKIAAKRETFVSESILVGSAADNKAVIIEKSPSGINVVESRKDFIISTNHFQSPAAQTDPAVIRDMKEKATSYRYRKVAADVASAGKLDANGVAAILRDRSGLYGEKPGMGNEKAVNQLIAHHSVIFAPSSRKVWVSAGPWQIGPYVCYDICKIFHNFAGLQRRTEIRETDQDIAPDKFLGSAEYNSFLRFRTIRTTLTDRLISKRPEGVTESYIKEFVSTNPEYFEVYEFAGDYFMQQGQTETSCRYYRKALQKVMPAKKDQDRIIRKLATGLAEMKK